MHRFYFSGSFCWGYFAKIERKCSRNRPKIFLKCSRIIFLQVCQILWIYLLESSSFCLTFWAQTWIHEELLLLFRKFLGEFVIFLQLWVFLQSCEVFANFCAKLFCKFFAKKSRDWAWFALLAFYYNSLFNIILLQMCANVCKSVPILCEYVQKKNLVGIALYCNFLLSFYKLLMLLWNSFSESWDLKIYFLKGIVEL